MSLGWLSGLIRQGGDPPGPFAPSFDTRQFSGCLCVNHTVHTIPTLSINRIVFLHTQMRMLSSFGDRILNMGARGRLTVIVRYSYGYDS